MTSVEHADTRCNRHLHTITSIKNDVNYQYFDRSLISFFDRESGPTLFTSIDCNLIIYIRLRTEAYLFMKSL